MVSTGLKQKDLAARSAIDPTTLNNFLNRQSNTLGGLAVALACTLVDLVCDGIVIGRTLRPSRRALETPGRQLVLEFDGTFESKRGSKHPTIVLRKPSHRNTVRLSIKAVG